MSVFSVIEQGAVSCIYPWSRLYFYILEMGSIGWDKDNNRQGAIKVGSSFIKVTENALKTFTPGNTLF